ncbi:MAG: methyltransferase domain-containing protein [Candidatus Krumholzibacteriota bacterium]|nr:methyltransferase domain-containing protein [Candidatus Krumholzibacteriota bacterium]
MIWEPVEPTTQREIEDNRMLIQAQDAVYRKHGVNRSEVIEFIVNSAEPFRPPVLDIGTGKGFAAIALAKRGLAVKTVDISEEELRAAYLNAKGAGVNSLIEYYLIEPRKGLPFQDDYFNLVTMISVLHHIKSIRDVLPEISRVMAPGGKLLISDFTEQGFSILAKVFRKENRVHTRVNQETIDDIAAHMKDYNLRCASRDIRFNQHLMVVQKN